MQLVFFQIDVPAFGYVLPALVDSRLDRPLSGFLFEFGALDEPQRRFHDLASVPVMPGLHKAFHQTVMLLGQ